VQETVIIKK